MTKYTRIAAAIGLALALAGTAPVARADAESDMAPTDKQLNQLYWEGQEDLKRSDWPAALARFQELERELRAKEPKNVDTALYWQAYTLMRQKRTTEAGATATRLHREFPRSRWADEVDALVRAPRAATASSDISIAGDADLAAVAVEGLMNAKAERAVPLLIKVLASNHPPKVKKRALFVLGQFGTPQALDAVVNAARTDPDEDLREEAIRMLGVSGDNAAVERLRELYASARSSKEKREIIQSWMVAGRKDLIVAAARNDPDERARRTAIQMLGAMGAGPELKQMFDANQDERTRRNVVEALGVAGDVDAIAAIAGGNYSEDVRAHAMHALGVAGSRGGRDALIREYGRASSEKIRKAALQGLLITGDTKAVMGLYRSAKSSEEKQELLRTITIMDGDAAVDLIEADLER